MFIRLTLCSSGRPIVFRADAIVSFAGSSGFTAIKADGKVFEVAETVDEILAQLAGDRG